MKKIFIVLLVLFPLISFASIDTNLQYGSRGTVVSELQDFLISKDFLTGQASGNFFSLTRNAVTAYQTSAGLPTTGFVGPLTRTKINAELSLANASSTADELAETGTTTSPVQTGTSAIQQQIQALLAQIAQLNTHVSQLNQTIATTTQITQTPKTYTLPNGAVVDANGNTITPAPIVQTTPVSNPQATQSNSNLILTLGNTTTTFTSAHISWSTNIPTNAKVFLTMTDGSTQVIPSASGYSTSHFADISNLKANNQYTYVVEATNGIQDQKVSGVINTDTSVPISIQGVKSDYYVPGAGCSTIRFQLSILDSDGSVDKDQIMTMTTPDSTQNISFSNKIYEPGDHSFDFIYIPQSTSTNETLTFSSGSLSSTTVVHTDVNPFLNDQKMKQAIEQGVNVKISNGKCVSPIYEY